MGKEKRFKRGLGLMTGVMLIVLLGVPVTAAPDPPEAADSPAVITMPQADDNYLEVGVEWVNDYPYCCRNTASGQVCGNHVCDLSLCDDDAVGLYNRLGGCGWIRRFNYGDSWAWEEDFKGRYKSGGGTEYRYVDTVDMAYFAGHGNSVGFYFGEGGRNHDDHQLHYNDCRQEWGDGDMEWMAIASCKVLENSHRTDWAWCFDGLHLLMGFVTNMADAAHGYWFGWLVCNGYNMTQAWFTASDISQPSGRIARVIAEEPHHFYDRPSDHNASDAMNYAYYHWMDHHTASAPPLKVDVEQLQGEMPVFLTPELSLDQANAEWEKLGTAFGVSTPPRSSPQSVTQEEIWTSDDNQLHMDPSSGLYGYTELDSLWAEPAAATADAGPTHVLTPQDAKEIADQFLNDNNLMPADAVWDQTEADTLTDAEKPSSRFAPDVVLQTETVAWQVVYSRILTYTPPVALDAVQQPIEFSVMGPGSKLKVFVAPEQPVGRSVAAPAQDAIIGGVGGWRPASVPGGQRMAVQDTVPILTYEQIEKLFEQLEPTVALSYIPLVSESRVILDHTVAYYEHPMGTGQDQLIPVYALEVEYTLESQEVSTDTVYIPANEEFMAPLAWFTPTVEVPEAVGVGHEIVFEAKDASANLSTLGYDALLDFPLGSGDPDSYLYNWYLDTADAENLIGTGPVFTYTVALPESAHPGADLIGQTIILEVVDSLSARPPSASYDTFGIDVIPPVYLPVVLRNH